MASTFSGLYIGRSGLSASQQGLNVTSHNISNTGTVGYTRQRIVQGSVNTYSSMSKFMPLTSTNRSAGTTVLIQDQIRSDFYDMQYRAQTTNLAYWSTRSTALTFTEGILDATSDASITESLNTFFHALNVTTEDPTGASLRTTIQQSAINLCDNLNVTYNQLIDLMKDMSSTMESWVDQINSYADSLASLNQQIYLYELSGQPANELRDQRNLILDDLANIADLEYYTDVDTGNFVVKLAGKELVNGDTVVNTVKLGSEVEPITGMTINTVVWSNGSAFNSEGGEVAGLYNALTSMDPEEPGIVYFINELNIFTRALVQNFNAIHVTGYTYNPDGSPSTSGILFFDDCDGKIDYVTAGNVRLSDDVLDSIWNIACSSTATTTNDDANNNEILKEMFGLLTATDLTYTDGNGNPISIGNLNEYLDAIYAKLGLSVSGCNEKVTLYSNQATNMDTLRTSISGVSMDEEMVNLIQYQYAYQGASRIITTIDEMLNVLINRMGVVGLN